MDLEEFPFKMKELEFLKKMSKEFLKDFTELIYHRC